MTEPSYLISPIPSTCFINDSDRWMDGLTDLFVFSLVFYTGNGTIARIIAAATAKHLTPLTLELGGKSPMIVDPKCDLELAAKRTM
ncbi:hypothetical protein GYMLUDRAFT_50331 [Collybiopsis luxurians FD-317 M1]|uniref:Aldehyde dehydrogenase domain-containing protein n=1 Tax=Collybiopsis luxurians FD-317 M1 TaxID=944289 RepID=A0A0D0C1T9_9AGAR|nr:hypothetical protein GYMLUDRAFT_50331 [Collybiopsis luxurians FD-317 M1]